MREADISTKRFRELAKEVGSLLTYEATADFETEKVTIDGWNGPVEVDQIKGKKVTVVPILRAGLFLDVLLEFRVAVNAGESFDKKTIVLPDMPISGTVEGTKRDIECTICGSKRTLGE